MDTNQQLWVEKNVNKKVWVSFKYTYFSSTRAKKFPSLALKPI